MTNNTKIGERSDNLITEYCLLRYRHELELKKLKISLDIELDNIFNRTDFISRRNIDNHRAAYAKLINTRFSNDNTDSINNTKEISLYIYSNLIDYLHKNNSRSKDSYLDNYTKCKSEILNYYKTYFDNKLKIKEFKEVQFNELRLISQQLKEDETPVYIATNIYKRLKSDLHILKHNSNELEYCRGEYELLKNKLLSQIEEINKEFN